jgi:hypothetical protein
LEAALFNDKFFFVVADLKGDEHWERPLPTVCTRFSLH